MPPEGILNRDPKRRAPSKSNLLYVRRYPAKAINSHAMQRPWGGGGSIL